MYTPMLYLLSILCSCVLCAYSHRTSFSNVSASATLVWGPGLKTDFRVPVRYFFIQAVSKDGQNLTESAGDDVFKVSIVPSSGIRARVWVQVLDRHDGSYIVRYRLFSSNEDLFIQVQLADQDVAQSPYLLKGMVYHETCNCPTHSPEEWAESVGCPATFGQIGLDLEPFMDGINMASVVKKAVEKFNERGSHSLCHYRIKDNKIYRKCYGQHVGFNMFSDAILLSLTRKMVLPDFDFLMNLGDWPLEHRDGGPKGKSHAPLPVMSWCGSQETYDIVLPTYDLTEATLEMMGRVSLDIFSTQANTGPKWDNKTNVAFWRGRDSRRERLDLVELSRKNPGLLDAALTNMFFFPKDESKYGPIQKQVSFFQFFKSKYQLNIDGTVAAYRFPYLLAGDSVVFKQDSNFYEHFYNDLQPYKHYIPLARDLKDIIKKLKWARQNDEEVRQIAKNAQEYVRTKLNPVDILCYHTRLFQEFSKLLKKKPKKTDDFELVPQKDEPCGCRMPAKPKHTVPNRDEF